MDGIVAYELYDGKGFGHCLVVSWGSFICIDLTFGSVFLFVRLYGDGRFVDVLHYFPISQRMHPVTWI